MVNKDLFVLENFENKLMTRYHILPSLWVETWSSARRPRPSGAWPRGVTGTHALEKVAAFRRTIWVWWGQRRVIQWLQSRHLVI